MAAQGDGDLMTRDEVKDIADLAANAAVEKMRVMVKEELAAHVESCPVKAKITRMFLYAIAAGGAGGGISKLLDFFQR